MLRFEERAWVMTSRNLSTWATTLGKLSGAVSRPSQRSSHRRSPLSRFVTRFPMILLAMAQGRGLDQFARNAHAAEATCTSPVAGNWTCLLYTSPSPRDS